MIDQGNRRVGVAQAARRHEWLPAIGPDRSARPTPAAPPDLATALLCAFLFINAILNRQFSYLKLGPMFISEVVLLLLLYAAAYRCLVGGATGRLRSPLTVLIVFYLLAGTLSLVRGLPAYGFGALKDSALAYYAVTCLVILVLVRDLGQIRRLLGAMVVGSWLAALTLLPYFVPSLYGWISRAFPLRVGAAVYLMLEFSILLRLCVGYRVPQPWRRVWTVIAVVQFALVILGRVRSAWVSLLAGLAFLFLYAPGADNPVLRRIPRPVSLGLVALPFVFAAVIVVGLLPGPWSPYLQPVVHEWSSLFEQTPENTVSYQNRDWRLAIWRSAAEQAAERPLFGTPFGEIFVPHRAVQAGYDVTEQADNEVHNSPLSVWLRMGLLGIGSFLAIQVVFFRHMHRWVHGNPDPHLRRLGTALMACVATVLVHSLSCVVLEGPYMAMPYWMILAFGMILLRRYPLAAEALQEDRP